MGIKTIIKKFLPASSYIYVRDAARTTINYMSLVFRRDKTCSSPLGRESVLLIDKRSLGGGSIRYSRKWQVRTGATRNVIVLDHQIYSLFEVSVSDVKTEMLLLSQERLASLIEDYNISRIIVNQVASLSRTELQRVLEVIEKSGVPYEYIIHDFFCLCPSITQMHEDNVYRGPDCLTNPSCPHMPAMQEWRILWGAFLRGAEEIHAVSNFSRNCVLHVFPDIKVGVRHPKVSELPTIYDPKNVERRPLVIGIMGHISQIKGARILIEIAEKIADSGLPIQLKLFGTLEEKVPLRARNILSVLGKYTEEDIANLIERQEVSLFLFPSLVPETYSLVCDEIIQLGFPILMFNIGAQVERIRNGRYGWMTSVDTSGQSLFEEISGLYHDRKQILEKARNIKI